VASFGDLQTSIAQKLNNANLSTEIKTAINSTIDFYENEHLWFQEAQSTITLTIDQPIVPNIPSDFNYGIANAGLVINDNSARFPLRKITPDEYDELNKEGQGRPLFYTSRIDQLEVYPFPDQAYSLILFYIKTYTDLVNTIDTNDFTANAPRLIEAKTLADLYLDQRHDEKISKSYEIKATRELQILTKRSRKKIATGRLAIDSLVGQPSFGRFNFNLGRF